MLITHGKKLIFPQEIEVWYVIPAIRKAFALELIKAGLPQKKIAQMLDVTEAAITQYKNEKRAQQVVFNKVITEEIKKSALTLRNNPEALFQEIMRIGKLVKSTGLFCELHRSKCATPDECETTCYIHNE